MTGLKNFGRFWYDFVVGDDWRIALGVLCSTVATWVLSRRLHLAWLIIPMAVTLLLGVSLGRAQRAAWSVDPKRRREP